MVECKSELTTDLHSLQQNKSICFSHQISVAVASLTRWVGSYWNMKIASIDISNRLEKTFDNATRKLKSFKLQCLGSFPVALNYLSHTPNCLSHAVDCYQTKSLWMQVFKSWELGLLKSLLMQLAQFAPQQIAATEDGNPTRKRDKAPGNLGSLAHAWVTIKLQF